MNQPNPRGMGRTNYPRAGVNYNPKLFYSHADIERLNAAEERRIRRDVTRARVECKAVTEQILERANINAGRPMG